MQLLNQQFRKLQIAREVVPSVIVLDVMLPGQDGLEVLQNLKNHPATRQIPVLICSVLDTRELVLSLGADGFLRSPSVHKFTCSVPYFDFMIGPQDQNREGRFIDHGIQEITLLTNKSTLRPNR